MPCLAVTQQYFCAVQIYCCASNELNNMGCAKGTTAVDEFLQRNVHFAFREQTFIQVKRAEAIFHSKFI